MVSLTPLDGDWAIVRLAPETPLPDLPTRDPFISITRTPEETSIVCAVADVPPGARFEGGWRLIKVEGPFDLSQVGILASLASPLAAAGIPLMAISTFDTDYLLVRRETAGAALEALSGAGHRVGPPA